MAKKRKRRSSKKGGKGAGMLPLILVVLVLGGVFAYLYFAGKTEPIDEETAPTESIAVNVKPGQGQEEAMNLAKQREKDKLKQAAASLSANQTPASSDETTDEDSTEKEELVTDSGYVEVYFFDVGQGDSILVKYIDTDDSDGDDSASMLVDAGDTNCGTKVRSYLSEAGVDKLTYFVCTHPDADHIGGAASVVSNIPITTEVVWGPNCKKDTKTYNNLINEISYRSYKYMMPELCRIYPLGGAEVVFFGPTEEYDDTNDNSLVCTVRYKDSSLLLTGDCSEAEENDMLDEYSQSLSILDVDILKVAHHGSQSASRRPFLDAVSPSYAVISCGIDNSYGHPNQSVLERLTDTGATIYRTDELGSIICTMNGTHDYKWDYQK